MDGLIIGGVSIFATVIMWIHDKSSKLDARLDAMELHMASIETKVVASEGLAKSAIQETDAKYALAVQALASEMKRSNELLLEQRETYTAHRAEFKALCAKIDNLSHCAPK